MLHWTYFEYVKVYRADNKDVFRCTVTLYATTEAPARMLESLYTSTNSGENAFSQDSNCCQMTSVNTFVRVSTVTLFPLPDSFSENPWGIL